MLEELNHNRRHFLRNATVAFAAAELAAIGSADAQSIQASTAPVPQIRPGTNELKGDSKGHMLRSEKKIQATSSFGTRTMARANRLS